VINSAFVTDERWSDGVKTMQHISRRKFVALTAAGLSAPSLAQMARSSGDPVTAQALIDRIRQNVGGEWQPDTADTFKAGDPSTRVTGIVTTSLASLDALDRAVRAGANLILTSEPTFFARADTPTPTSRHPLGQTATQPGAPLPQSAPDPVFTAKNDFVKKHKLVIWRFSDHWRKRTPDPFSQGLGNALGWSKLADVGQPNIYSIPETTLYALASHVKRSLRSRGGMRIVGDPKLRIRKVAFLPGSTPIQASVEILPQVDAIIAGEVREWESVEYVRDTVDLGFKKSLVLVGRIVSEGPGMQICAEWLKTLVPEVASTWIPVDDPYWRPPQ
jgi:putative NIF3 family GTP cyclohydrolase 1 type 2